MDQQILNLISDIYSAASSPDEWKSVAQKIQKLVGGHSVHLAMSDPCLHRVDCIFSNGLSRDETLWYNREIAHRDQLTELFHQVNPGTAFLLQDHYSPAQLHKLSCYEDFYDKVGLNDFAASYFYQDQGTQGWCTVARSKTDTPFTQEQSQLLSILTPHLARAMQINLQLSSARQSQQLAVDSLESLPMGVALLSSDNRAVSFNSRVSCHLRPASLGSGYELCLPCPEAQQQLTETLQKIIRRPDLDNSCCLTFSHDGHACTAIVTPWVSSAAQQTWLPGNPCCMVMINQHKADDGIPMEWLRQRYGLSKSEARVLALLLTGCAAKEIADQLCVSTHTARFHIKNLLIKTDSGSQTKAVVKVLRDFSGMY